MNDDNIRQAAQEVFRELGAGYAEKVYEAALAVELRLRGIEYERQRTLEISYKNHTVGIQNPDLVVLGETVIELKVGSKLGPAERRQLRRYLRTMGKSSGLLINFPTDAASSEPEIEHVLAHEDDE